MAHPSVLRLTLNIAGVLLLTVLAVLQIFFSGAGCAIVHRYPAYRGRVLELGTDKPIEGAGALACYQFDILTPVGSFDRYLGFQAVLTDRDGRFEIPARWFLTVRPFSRFVSEPMITINKKGYGSFPGSFSELLRRPGKSDPELIHDKLPPGNKVTSWLPKLEPGPEWEEHEKGRLGLFSDPPPGMNPAQFHLFVCEG